MTVAQQRRSADVPTIFVRATSAESARRELCLCPGCERTVGHHRRDLLAPPLPVHEGQFVLCDGSVVRLTSLVVAAKLGLFDGVGAAPASR